MLYAVHAILPRPFETFSLLLSRASSFFHLRPLFNAQQTINVSLGIPNVFTGLR